MTHNVKSELRRSMDAIHFSGDDKERMVALLMSAEAPVSYTHLTLPTNSRV